MKDGNTKAVNSLVTSVGFPSARMWRTMINFVLGFFSGVFCVCFILTIFTGRRNE